MTHHDTTLNTGGGICRPEAQLIMRPTAHALELGAGLDAVRLGMSALHQLNRHAGDEGYIAAALPEFGRVRRNGPGGGLRCGTELVAVGSEMAIEKLSKMVALRKAVSRGLIEAIEPDEIFVEEGESCAAWYRDRRPERATPAGQRRRKERHERIGMDHHVGPDFKSFAGTYASMKIGKVTTFVGMTRGVWSGAEIKVSTYGLCSRVEPAFLPVAMMPEGNKD